jgi:hypothetical protein
MNKSGIIIAVIAVLVIAIIVVIVIASRGPATNTPANTETKAIDKQVLGDISDDIKSISGKIISISGNTLIINALISMKDPSSSPINHNTSVAIDNNTTITKFIYPTPEKAMSSPTPIETKQSPLNLSNLKVGELIEVRSLTNIYDNLKANTPFNASTINVIVYE